NDPQATGGFNVFISEGAGSAQYITTLAAGSTSYTYTGTVGGITITDGGTYTATVQALPDADNNAYANSGAFNLNAPDPEPPTNPTGLSITQATDEFTLNWDNDPLATGGFNIFVSKNTDAIQYVTTVAAGSTSYTYQGTLAGIPITTDGTIYTVTVQALPDADNNNYSNALVYTGNINEVTLPDNDPNFHIYLAFGQSNMEGSAPVENSDFTTNNRLLLLQSLDCSNLGREKNKWYVMAPPASQCFSQLSLVNTFGKEMVNSQPSDVNIGIINVAVGGADIRLFDKDKFEDHDELAADPFFAEKIQAYGGNPYQHLVNLGLLAKQKGVIKGILLHQGESNNGDTNWPNYVKTVYDNLIADLGLDADQVPLLAGEVGHTNNGGLAGSMNTIIQTLPSVIPTAHIISSEGVTILPDNVHFDSAGVRELGKRYAQKMTSLLTTLSTEDVTIQENEFGLIQNQPNPVVNNTNISFTIPAQTHVSLKVFSVSGIEVAELINNELSAGTHSVEFRKENLAAGYYIYTLQTKSLSESRKMIIVSE
ncbi:sialate O-acetylesterase, partial [Tenacibaculum agarivorans]|uniref:sialate O-acetylesterase n=1 Tax=Tenacibaculum agarivorans TaxID=1908389 RepID=UPI00094BB6F8